MIMNFRFIIDSVCDDTFDRQVQKEGLSDIYLECIT